MEIVEFLRARLDEDEQAAKAADVKQGDPEWKMNPVVAAWPRTYRVRSRRDNCPVATVADVAGDDVTDHTGILDGEAASEHIARHNPARVLAEVEAKRQRLDAYIEACEAVENTADLGDWSRAPVERAHAVARRDVLREAVELDALPYVGHPDYRDEWRP